MKVIGGVLNTDELKIIKDFLLNSDFLDGKLTAGKLSQQKKNNLQLDRAAEGSSLLDEVIIKALSRSELFVSMVRPKTFSAPIYARYEPGMKYGAHVDAPLMGLAAVPMRTDLSITVFLNEPSDYEGGELQIETEGGVHNVKLPAGSIIIYPTTYLHQVKEVTSGKREVAVLWAQSYVKDTHIRSTLFDLHAATESISHSADHSVEAQLLQKSLLNLERYFIDC